jgi:hypothetical protein
MKDRGRVTARLRKIADQLRRFKRMEIARIAIIGRARIPIIKVRVCVLWSGFKGVGALRGHVPARRVAIIAFIGRAHSLTFNRQMIMGMHACKQAAMWWQFMTS